MITEYKVTLKTEEEMKESCYETDEGSLGLDGIALDYNVLKDNDFLTAKAVGTYMYDVDDNKEYGIVLQSHEGKKTIVHLSWIHKINNTVTLVPKPYKDNIYYITRKYLLDLSTNELIDRGTLPVCSCGGLGVVPIEGGYLCQDCADTLTKKENYSYRPDFKYIGNQIKADTDNNVWFGLEVEISTDRTKLATYMSKYKDSVYLKDDSSIRGDKYNVEVVSMPHSFKALMAKDSWIEGMSKLPNKEANENGCHIHLSRTAFVSDKHYSLFYFLLHKMETISTKVGGRELTDYCRLSPSGKVHTKENKSSRVRGRSVYLNEQGDPTVEARFFKGTVKSKNLKAYVQYIESILKYTKYNSKSVSVKGWFGYITKKSKKYTELLEVLGDLTAAQLEMRVVFREPTKIIKYLKNITMTEARRISDITLTNGKTYNNIEVTYLNIRRGTIVFEDQTGESFEKEITKIDSLFVEEA